MWIWLTICIESKFDHFRYTLTIPITPSVFIHSRFCSFRWGFHHFFFLHSIPSEVNALTIGRVYHVVIDARREQRKNEWINENHVYVSQSTIYHSKWNAKRKLRDDGKIGKMCTFFVGFTCGMHCVQVHVHMHTLLCTLTKRCQIEDLFKACIADVIVAVRMCLFTL